MIIESKITRVGSWNKIIIVSVMYGFSQRLKDGKWVNTSENPERHETEILTLGKCFSDIVEAEKFLKTKTFKALLNTIQKHWK